MRAIEGFFRQESQAGGSVRRSAPIDKSVFGEIPRRSFPLARGPFHKPGERSAKYAVEPQPELAKAGRSAADAPGSVAACVSTNAPVTFTNRPTRELRSSALSSFTLALRCV